MQLHAYQQLVQGRSQSVSEVIDVAVVRKFATLSGFRRAGVDPVAASVDLVATSISVARASDSFRSPLAHRM